MTTPVDLTWLKTRFPDLSNLHPLGQGGQKLVFSATHPTDGEVVLKIVHPKTDLESVRREILAVQQIKSARVPLILENGIADTHLGPCVWLREKKIPGETLRQVLTRGPLPALDVLKLGVHVIEALERAENVQIVHRDVKPDNIIQDTAGDFWLLDFGIARHLDLTSLTATASPFGKMTLGYAPPEQCRNFKRDIDSRADLFALGVTLHESANGINHFFNPPPRDHLELLRRVENQVLPTLTLPVASSESFRDIVASMTQKNRIHRPRTVSEAAVWLNEIWQKQS